MPLSAGDRLGPYEILTRIGAGGMGEVWRATDTKLNRDVAIKILPEAFANDADRLARFTREAQVLASLNHPNIAAIHGVEERAIVMELVEGENLKGPIPLEEALPIAKQIAEALEYAHERGIVHRDLKPANVKVTPDGRAKVLDFGLAAVAQPSGGEPASQMSSPTLTMRATQLGVILGTAAYMSPEQARGKPVDKRTDIWAFGVVLFEILTGRNPYGSGETVTDVLSAVIAHEPDYTALPPETPPRIRKLVERCLRKDPKLRLRDIGEARLVLDEAEPESPVSARPVGRRYRWTWAAAVLFALTASWFAWRASRPAALGPLQRMSLALPPDATIDFLNNPLAITNDSARIAVVLRGPDGKSQIYTRSLREVKLTPLPGTENAAGPFFSPDGHWIGFFDLAASKLKKIAVEGGPALLICDAASVRGASWGDDGNIVAAMNTSVPLMRVSASGGTPQTLAPLKSGEVTQRWPQVLPGSRAVIFTSHSSNSDYDSANIDLVLTKTGERRTLVRAGFSGQYASSGHLVYFHQSTLFAAPFDADRLVVTGPAVPIVDTVFNAGTTGAVFAASGAGLAMYLLGTDATRIGGVFTVDETGKKELLHDAASTRGITFAPHFSPDGKRVVFIVGVSVRSDVWVKDLASSQATRLTFLPGINAWPVWSPDGTILYFTSSNSRFEGKLYWIRSDGAGGPQVLSDSIRNATTQSISPDGRHLALQQSVPNQSYDIVTAAIEGDPSHPHLGKIEPFAATPAQEMTPAFSPDGRWIAYSSNESGTFEVYVRPFPAPGGRWQVSNGGGIAPQWVRHTSELLYETPTRQIMRVDYSVAGDSFTPGRTRSWPGVQLGDMGPNEVFDVAPDGKRLAAILALGGSSEKPSTDVTFLVNFLDELKRRVK